MGRRRYVSDFYEPGEDDKYARDEGYYYEWCPCCRTNAEHEDGTCLTCEKSKNRKWR